MTERKKHLVWSDWDVDFTEHSRQIINIINPGKDESILDAAIGKGRYAIPMAKKGAYVTGVDNSREMIKKCSEKIREHNLGDRIGVVYGDLNQKLPLEDSKFDKVVSLGTLIHIENYENTIKEFIRVTKPGGLIITENSNLYHISPIMEKIRQLFEIKVLGKRFEDVVPIYLRSPKNIAAPFIENGCEIEDTYGFYILLPNTFPYFGTRLGIAQHSKLISYGLMRSRINRLGATYIVKARKTIGKQNAT